MLYKLRHAFERNPHHFILPFIFLLITVYFSVHAIRGNRGLIRFFEINEEIMIADQKLENTNRIRQQLEKRVSALSAKQMDLDLLEDVGRRIINVGEKQDYIIFE